MQLLGLSRMPQRGSSDGLRPTPSFLALDTRRSCSCDYRQRGRRRCYSSCRGAMSLLPSPQQFGLLHAGFSIWGLHGWGMMGTGQGRPYVLVGGQWGRREETRKLGTRCYELQKNEEFRKPAAQCGDVPLTLKDLLHSKFHQFYRWALAHLCLRLPISECSFESPVLCKNLPSSPSLG